MNRYTNTTIFENDEEYYEYLRRKRGIKNATHYATPVLKNPSVLNRIGVPADQHIWKYGDRFYNLSYQYYGDSKYWWVIAWYNGMPTEAHLQIGDLIQIPLKLEDAYVALGV